MHLDKLDLRPVLVLRLDKKLNPERVWPDKMLLI